MATTLARGLYDLAQRRRWKTHTDAPKPQPKIKYAKIDKKALAIASFVMMAVGFILTIVLPLAFIPLGLTFTATLILTISPASVFLIGGIICVCLRDTILYHFNPLI